MINSFFNKGEAADAASVISGFGFREVDQIIHNTMVYKRGEPNAAKLTLCENRRKDKPTVKMTMNLKFHEGKYFTSSFIFEKDSEIAPHVQNFLSESFNKLTD